MYAWDVYVNIYIYIYTWIYIYIDLVVSVVGIMRRPAVCNARNDTWSGVLAVNEQIPHSDTRTGSWIVWKSTHRAKCKKLMIYVYMYAHSRALVLATRKASLHKNRQRRIHSRTHMHKHLQGDQNPDAIPSYTKESCSNHPLFGLTQPILGHLYTACQHVDHTDKTICLHTILHLLPRHL